MIQKKDFGITPEGKGASLFVLSSEGGIEAHITDFGGIITALHVPDRHGKKRDIVLGHESLESYLTDPSYLGALIGRYANRIREGTFSIDGTSYQVTANTPPHHLHGGSKGFDRCLWESEAFTDGKDAVLQLSYISVHGEEGFPGEVSVTVTYRVSGNELHISYGGTTDRITHLNLTNHSYFNFTGGRDSVLRHCLTVNAREYTESDASLIPTGKILPVEGTALDFTEARTIGERIASPLIAESAKGYDHNYILDKPEGVMGSAARVTEETSGIAMELSTTHPGLQFYSGNFLDGSIRGQGDIIHETNWGLCLEPQHFPDSPNQPHFPSTLLRSGEVYTQKSIYRFSLITS